LVREDVDKEVLAVDGGEALPLKDAKKGKTPRKLVQDEDRATGHVEWWAPPSQRFIIVSLLIVLCASSQGCLQALSRGFNLDCVDHLLSPSW
jgi:hypothetical protein